MRHEVRLLGGKLKIIIFFLPRLSFQISYPTASKLLTPDMTDHQFHTPQTTCYCACENQIEHVISHAVKESNTT